MLEKPLEIAREKVELYKSTLFLCRLAPPLLLEIQFRLIVPLLKYGSLSRVEFNHTLIIIP